MLAALGAVGAGVLAVAQEPVAPPMSAPETETFRSPALPRPAESSMAPDIVTPAAESEEASSAVERQAPRSQPSAYMTPDGSKRFVLDQSGEDIKVRFDGQDEVYVLRDEPAQRGERLLKLDTGEVLLRVTTWGGLTLFTPDQRQGVPVERAGDAAPLGLADRPIADVRALVVALEADLRHATGHDVPVVCDWAAAEADAAMRAILFDAISNLRSAIGLIGVQGLEPGELADALSEVQFIQGDQAAAGLDAGVLTIAIAPQMGLDGRLSSGAIAAIIVSRL